MMQWIAAALQRHVLKPPPQTPYKMWPAAEALRRIERRLEMMAGTGTQTAMHAQALRRIERRLEMMIGAQTAVCAPETNSAHAQEVQGALAQRAVRV